MLSTSLLDDKALSSTKLPSVFFLSLYKFSIQKCPQFTPPLYLNRSYACPLCPKSLLIPCLLALSISSSRYTTPLPVLAIIFLQKSLLLPLEYFSLYSYLTVKKDLSKLLSPLGLLVIALASF